MEERETHRVLFSSSKYPIFVNEKSMTGFHSGIMAFLLIYFLRLSVTLKWEERLKGECVSNDQTVWSNFSVEDYGDLNGSYSRAYILFVDDVFDFDMNSSKRLIYIYIYI